MKNINAIFGISYGFDGITFNFGFNLAGITVKFPVLLSNSFPDADEEHSEEDKLEPVIYTGIVVGFFLATTYLFHR
eukprot:CAMPEP_0168347614 /NCGR_PEP_ID=MMETSP0213-20121227/19119_1 /TAXON_ID=151035 /ORGANISM="Euplotes harpa, Strain FSP1.4" /LENGTH=75 /DNA_ID=CAMNT_0008356785 /DNA_START=206 /DNA_END=430 /DNA_ORIENTATION=+